MGANLRELIIYFMIWALILAGLWFLVVKLNSNREWNAVKERIISVVTTDLSTKSKNFKKNNSIQPVIKSAFDNVNLGQYSFKTDKIIFLIGDSIDDVQANESTDAKLTSYASWQIGVTDNGTEKAIILIPNMKLKANELIIFSGRNMYWEVADYTTYTTPTYDTVDKLPNNAFRW